MTMFWNSTRDPAITTTFLGLVMASETNEKGWLKALLHVTSKYPGRISHALQSSPCLQAGIY